MSMDECSVLTTNHSCSLRLPHLSYLRNPRMEMEKATPEA
jgi:hypothetical protein